MYAHKDLETVLSEKHDAFLSKHEDVKELIKLAHEIWNRYSQIWEASTYSTMIIYGDDYKWLFEYLRRGMKVKRVLENRNTKRWQKRIDQINEQMKPNK